jgi:hypothetical protein
MHTNPCSDTKKKHDKDKDKEEDSDKDEIVEMALDLATFAIKRPYITVRCMDVCCMCTCMQS